ncbi:hypothetical protein HWV62_29256 [Athelia sp. TMB]|nr:hypothetical protein HWV62_29256 [Athelia sp. TMB]
MSIPTGLNNAGVPASAPAGAGSSGGLPSSTSGSLNPYTQPIPIVSITTAMLSAVSNDTSFKKLSLNEDNYMYWRKLVLGVLELGTLDDYVLGKIIQPSHSSDPASYWNFINNNRKVVAFIKRLVEDPEKDYMNSDGASIAWANLATRHQKRGAISQIRLIQQLFSIRYSSDIASVPAVQWT